MTNRRFLFATAIPSLIFSFCANAAAADSTPPAPAPSSPSMAVDPAQEALRAYVVQIVLPTVAADIVSVAGVATDRPVAVLVGYGARSMVGPIVHFARGRIGAGLLSIVFEAGVPLLGVPIWFLHYAATCDSDVNHEKCDERSDKVLPIAMSASAILGTVLDATLLTAKPAKPAETKRAGVSWAPFVAPPSSPGKRRGELGGAWTFGVAGRF